MEAIVPRHKLSINITLHSVLFALSLFLSCVIGLSLRESTVSWHEWFLGQFVPMLPFFLGLKLILFGHAKLLRGGWRYASIREVANILYSSWLFLLVAFSCLILFVVMPSWLGKAHVPALGAYFGLFPKGVLFLDFLATVFLVSAARLGFRIYREELRPISTEGVRQVLVVGAGDASETIIREINRMRVERYRVIGMVDDDPGKADLTIHGIQVLGRTEDIRRICQERKVEEIIIAMPSATQKQLRRVIELCTGTKLKFQSLPGVRELIDGRVTVSQIRPVEINDLLGREAVELDCQSLAKFLKGRRVLITGAGGSIGSEMCRQVVPFGPAKLILVEQAETPLFDIENELRRDPQGAEIVACICDITDRQRVQALWQQHRPEVVIHAAAHKHVPLMECNPTEAIKNNILGTRNVADACCLFDVAEFVLISTDKAVNPSSIMGASKRVAELYVQALNGQAGCKTQFKAVRFGNVLGSSGSVIPTFRKQIAMGGPVTVTHPDMTRYFMTIPEASQLVLQAAATGQGGQIFLLDMGEPVKIVDLARQMITLSGFRPDEDIDIEFTGVRPGEKLFEELRTEGENIEPTMHPKIRIWKSPSRPWQQISQAIEELAKLQNCPSHARIVEAIKNIVPEYQPLNAPPEQAVALQESATIAIKAPIQTKTQA
jgi:FlaA1/EpsC-like NDP-sugar epimerase